MKKMNVNGHEVLTNYDADEYPRLPDDDMTAIPIPFRSTLKEFLEEKAEQGYTRVTFYHITTCVRGYHKIYARIRK